MKVDVLLQGAKQGLSTAAAIKTSQLEHGFYRVDVAVAYATKQGVLALERILGRRPTYSRWLIGLDDAITDPEALDYLKTWEGAEVKVESLSPRRRFHPKMYRLWKEETEIPSLLVVGSGNLTQHGLQENVEAATILEAQNLSDSRYHSEAFAACWELGHIPTSEELDQYRARHAEAQKLRQKIADLGAAPPDPKPYEPVGTSIPWDRTSEAEIALAVARIAARSPDGICSLDTARRLVPMMLPLTPGDLALSNSQPNAKWVQILRNTKSNARKAKSGSSNFIYRGYL